jgi:subtilisin
MRFTDLPDTHWAYNYVVYLYCRNIIGGYEDGTFRPHVDSTRGQIVKMIVLGMGWNLYNPYFPTFSDVQPDNPVYVYVETANFRGVVGGYADGTFRPNNPVTRAQAAKMLTTARAWPPVYPPEPSFVDVQPWQWEYGYVEAAFSRGIIGGYEDRTFRPHLHVTRAQLAKMLALTLQAGR